MRKHRSALLLSGFGMIAAGVYGLARLAAHYVPVKEKPHSSAPIIACMGDSITYGAGVADTRKTDTWERQLEAMFSGTYQVLNYGISGATLQDEGDFPYWRMKPLALRGYPEAALALHPEIVVFMLGTNDSKPYNWNAERYESDLRLRVKQILEAPSVKHLILMCPPYTCPTGNSDQVAFDIQNDLIRDEIRTAVKKCSADFGTECIDLYALTEGRPELFPDGVHPNREGNAVIAQAIHRHICGE